MWELLDIGPIGYNVNSFVDNNYIIDLTACSESNMHGDLKFSERGNF